ncbi:hypothetical protein KY346_00740 [Candidatus Woesearchaeota archaeon]|nr:hypothetical protein [Candidatus Woesearchaeota archaeon]
MGKNIVDSGFEQSLDLILKSRQNNDVRVDVVGQALILAELKKLNQNLEKLKCK